MGKVIAAYGGGFKPPQKGHFQVVEEALDRFPEIDEFIIYIGAKERDGISQAESILIWEIYQNYLPMKVKIEPVKAPIGDIIRLSKKYPQDTIYFIIGAREGNEEDQKDIASRTKGLEEKKPNIKIKTITTKDGNVSGTKARQAAKVSPEELFKYLPEKISDEDKQKVYDIIGPVIKEISLKDEDINEYVKSDFDRILYYQNYYTNLSPSTFDIDIVENDIVISGLDKPFPLGFEDTKDIISIPVDQNLEETLNEGRYDTISNKISSDIFRYWKEKINQGLAVFEGNYEHEGEDIEVEASLELSTDVDELKVDGGADDEEDFIAVNFKVNPNNLPGDWEKISFSLKDVIRHEIEHLTHGEGFMLKPGKSMENDQILRQMIDSELLPRADYFKLEKEIDANLQGMYFRAKKERRPFRDVVNVYLDTQELTPEEKNEIMDLWDKRTKALSLPSIQENLNEEIDLDKYVEDWLGKGGVHDSSSINRVFVLKLKQLGYKDFGTIYRILSIKNATKIPDLREYIWANYNGKNISFSKTLEGAKNFMDQLIDQDLLEKGETFVIIKQKSNYYDLSGWVKNKIKEAGGPWGFATVKDHWTGGLYRETQKTQEVLSTLSNNFEVEGRYSKRGKPLNENTTYSIKIDYKQQIQDIISERKVEIMDLLDKGTKSLGLPSIQENLNEEAGDKILYAFDLDDTLITSQSDIIITNPEKGTFKLTPAEYAVYKPHPEDEVDFTEFDYLKDPKIIKDNFNKFSSILSKSSQLPNAQTIILTARKFEVAKDLEEFLSKFDLPEVKLHAVGSSDPNDKVKVVQDYIDQGYNKIRFWDDSPKNIKQMKTLDSPEVDVKVKLIRHTPLKEILLKENATYSTHIDYEQQIQDLTQHMLDKGMNIEPLPQVEFIDGDSENAENFFGKTAYYDPNTQMIVLYTEGRHPKDIVRSFAHEMIHHIQNLEGRLEGIGTTNTTEDDNLNKIEQEAYLNGNITFRNWTDSLQENISKDPNLIYHWTSYLSCRKIIESDKLRSNESSQFFEYDESRDLPDYKNVVFFTIEGERFADEETSNQCVLVVDKSKLSKDYKVISYGDPYEETIVYTNDPSIPILPYLKGVILMNTLQKSALKKTVAFLESKNIPYEINYNLEKKTKEKKAKLPSLKKELINKLKSKYPNGFVGYLERPLLPYQTIEYFKDNPTYRFPKITINKPGKHGEKNEFKVKFDIKPQNLEKYINWFMYSVDSIEDLINRDNYEGEELNLKGEIPIDINNLQEKKDKDYFGLNQFARELAQGLEEETENIGLPEEEVVSSQDMDYVIYSDMDGVIVDFEERFKQFSDGVLPSEFQRAHGREKFWDLIDNQIGVRFWVGAPWMPDGKQYWDYIEKYKPILLSSPSRQNESRLGKRLWVKKHIPGTPLKLAYSANKKNYARENAILIDDRKPNIDQWIEAGGIGILHINAKDTIAELKKLGL
jgi:hypothetical protein